MQNDPIGYKDDMDLYSYVGNDPVNKTDPTGLTCKSLETGIGATCDYREQEFKNAPSSGVPSLNGTPRGTGLPGGIEAQGISPEIPEAHRAQMKILTGMARDARNEVDKSCTGFCRLPWIRGSLIHKAFADKVNSYSANYSAEVSYLNGTITTYGTAGSSRADAVYGDTARPHFAVELKTGLFSYVTKSEYENYMTNLPSGVPLYGIKVF